MKRILSIVSMLAIAAVSCNRESVESGDVPSKIGFATLMTRGSSVNNANGLDSAGGFKVWAYSHAGEWSEGATRTALLENTSVTLQGGEWTYGPPKEWPQTDYVSFFSYAPAGSATITGDASGVPAIKFTVDANPLLQKDFLIASAQYNQFGPYYTNNRKVSLFFNHALSQIRFAAIVDGAVEGTVKITKIELRNIYSSGETTLNVISSSPVAWTPDNTSATDYSVEISKGLLDVALNNIEVKEISTYNGRMFMIPQTVDRILNKPEMAVTLSIGGVEMTHTTSLFSPAVWVPGRAYTYQILVDGSSIRVVTIDTDMSIEPLSMSSTTQSITLSSNQVTDERLFREGITFLNDINRSGIVEGCTYFGIYAAYNLNHDIVIDMSSPEVNIDAFSKGQCLIIDFKKTIGTWGRDADNGDVRWKVSVVGYDPLDWELIDSFQTGPDALSGATSNIEGGIYPSNIMYNRGTVILRKTR